MNKHVNKNVNKSGFVNTTTPSSYIISQESISQDIHSGDVKTSSTERVLLGLLKHTNQLRGELRETQQATKRELVKVWKMYIYSREFIVIPPPPLLCFDYYFLSVFKTPYIYIVCFPLCFHIYIFKRVKADMWVIQS